MKQSTQKSIADLKAEIYKLENRLSDENSKLIDSEECDAQLCSDNTKFYGAKIDELEYLISELEMYNNKE